MLCMEPAARTLSRDGNQLMFMNGYRCFACAAKQSPDFAGYLCPSCGGNLDITYDYHSLATEIAAGFDKNQHDMFRYQPLLPVDEPKGHFPLRVGGTPLYQVCRLGRLAGLQGLFLKDDSRNPSASFKDRASAVVIRRAIETGAEVVSAASTGNAGSSLACLAAAHGLRAVIFVPENAPDAKLAQSLSFGASVLAVRGNYDDAFDLCLAASREFGWFNRSTGVNPFTREGKKTCSYVIWEDLGKQVPDRVVVPSGDGNIISGIWKGWRDLKAAGLIERLPKLDCAQSASSDAICRTVIRLRRQGEVKIDWSQVRVDEVSASTIADSISVNRPRDGLAAVQAIIESGGEAVTVSDEEILEAVPEMAASTGVFPEPAAAAPWAAIKKLAGNRVINPNDMVVCIVSGSGLKDIESTRAAVGSAKLIEPALQAVRDSFPGFDRK